MNAFIDNALSDESQQCNHSLKATPTITHASYSGYKRVSMTQKLPIVRDLRFEFIADALKTCKASLFELLQDRIESIVLKSLSMRLNYTDNLRYKSLKTISPIKSSKGQKVVAAVNKKSNKQKF